MASFPSSLKATFGARRQDLVSVVEADDVNELDDEVVAIEATLGRNPHVSTLFTAAATVADRLGLADDLLSTLKGWLNNTGTVTQAQVTGLSATLAGINTTLAGKAATSYVDSRDGATLTSAHSYTDTQVGAEATTRGSAVTGLQNQINTEVTNRTNADSAEVTNRTNADNALQTQVNNRSVIGHTHSPGASGIAYGQAFVSLNASGEGVIAHGLGYRPTMAVITHYTGGGFGGDIFCVVESLDTVYIHFRALLDQTANTMNAAGSSNVVRTMAAYSITSNYFWIAI